MSEHPIHAKGWQDAYGALRDRAATPLPRIEVQELKDMLERQLNGGAPEVVVVDVRRADCESNGRGPKAAGWYADALQDYLKLDDAQVAAKVGVVKGVVVAWRG